MKSILLVDDEPALRKSLAILLRREHYVVNEAQSVADALSQMQRGSTDLVITDLLMEPLDGVDLLAAVRRREPKCPVIIMTAYATPEKRSEALRLGAADFMEKPLEEGNFLNAISAILARDATGCG